ncbi:hypothetical protein C0214_19740 [Methylobacterium sp. DM1]|nr:hypothetical protein C0214_19740 [Methylobacterium sp. DM1]
MNDPDITLLIDSSPEAEAARRLKRRHRDLVVRDIHHEIRKGTTSPERAEHLRKVLLAVWG